MVAPFRPQPALKGNNAGIKGEAALVPAVRETGATAAACFAEAPGEVEAWLG